jgi:hypothetical protein
MEKSKEVGHGSIIRFKRLLFATHGTGEVSAETPQVKTDVAAHATTPLRRRRLVAMDASTLYERLRPVTKLSPEPPWPEPWSLYLLPMHFRQSRGNKNLLTFLDLLIDSVAAGQSLHSYTFFEQYYIHLNLTTIAKHR